VALAGGVGAARLLSGLLQVVDPSSVVAVVNTGDDMVLHGLYISPDIDTVTYTLAGMDNKETGWGITGESWTMMEELAKLGGETWFALGDRDLATHCYRSGRLARGATLSEVTKQIGEARGIGVTLLPMSDDPVRTRLTPVNSPGGSDPGELAFQEYFVREHHNVSVSAIRFDGADSAAPAPGVLDAIAGAERIIGCPSNPLVSIGPILSVPGIEEALIARREAVVAVSPIVAGKAIKGPADHLLTELGHEASVVGVARLYAPWVGTLVIDESDAALADRVTAEGVACVVAPTVMATPQLAATLAQTVLDA